MQKPENKCEKSTPEDPWALLLATRGIYDEYSLDVPESPEQASYTPVQPSMEHEEIINILEYVTSTGMSNADGCKIRVHTGWNVEYLQTQLVDYHDKEVVEYLMYGFPIERDTSVPLQMGGTNHKGATDFPEHIDRYVDRELRMGAMIGPLESIPFKTAQVAISPLSTRPKKDSTERRIIMDCSWPIGVSLNDGIDKTMYRG